jgi:tripartite-type tricarboxylate transporter receptor subunit TctC
LQDTSLSMGRYSTASELGDISRAVILAIKPLIYHLKIIKNFDVRTSRFCIKGRKNMKTINRREILAGTAAISAAVSLGISPALAQAGAWPNRPVTFVVPWGAGGGTDLTARIVSSILERNLKQPFSVVNRTGGSGVVGHSAIATAAPDGYTIGMVTVEITMMHHQGLTELNPTSYTPLALMNEDPPGVTVNSSSPYKTIKELADAIKASPAGKFKASGTGQGGIWHLALVGWLQAMGLKPDHVAWVPSNGAAPAMQDLAANGIDLVTCSIPEARAIIDAGRAKALAIMASERNPQFKDVPTLNETLGINYSVGAWRGIAAPKGLPADIQATLVAALKQAYDSTEFKEFMAGRGFGVKFADPAGFASFMADGDKKMSDAMKAAGLAKKT